MTLIEHLEGHIARMKSLNFSPWTIRQSWYCVRIFIRWLADNGVDSPEKLRARHLHDWQKKLPARTTFAGVPINARSINKHVETTTVFLRYMAGLGLIQKSMADELKCVKEPYILPGSVLSHDQMRRLLDAIETDSAEGYRLRTMLEVLYSSGIRVAELLGLNLKDVDMRNAVAKVMGKGRKERIVPIGRTAMQYLEIYIMAIRACVVRDPSEEALFLDSLGRRVRYFSLRRQIKACAKRIGLSMEISAHTFRRTCTTELLRGGANMYHVKELLGHESLETLKHYAKLTITDLKATHEKCHPRERDERMGMTRDCSDHPGGKDDGRECNAAVQKQ